MSVNETLVEDKMRRFKGKCAHLAAISVSMQNLALIHRMCTFSCHKCVNAKFSTTHGKDNSLRQLLDGFGIYVLLTNIEYSLFFQG